jgi:hypothetical protein
VSDTLNTPTKPGEWTLSQIQASLTRKLPSTMLSTKRVGGTTITFISWWRVNKILDKYAPGWTWEIINFYHVPDRVFIAGRLTIPTADGNIYREATGTEETKCSSYGDPSSNAESMAFRRAAARFGLGLHLYDKDSR